MTDKELLHLIIQGDENSYKELVSQYQSKLRNVSYGIVQDWNEAEDIVQETFVEVFRNIHKFRGDARISTWVYRIAVNKSLNFVRKQKSKGWLTSRLDTIINTKGQKEISIIEENVSESDEKIARLNLAINSLNNKQKKAFTLFFYDELSQKEIAEILNTSTSAVEQLIFRAKQKLKSKLGLFN